MSSVLVPDAEDDSNAGEAPKEGEGSHPSSDVVAGKGKRKKKICYTLLLLIPIGLAMFFGIVLWRRYAFGDYDSSSDSSSLTEGKLEGRVLPAHDSLSISQ